MATAFLAAAALGLIALLLFAPAMRTIESRRNLSEAEAELAKEKATTAQLEGRKNRALTMEFIEREARRMGYVKPGEIPIIVIDEKPAETSPEDPSPTPAP